jgi:hypothetical protein
MKPYFSYFILLLLTLSLSGCDILVGIFKGGMWVGSIMVVLVIVAVIWLFSRLMGRRR